tara:strand:+ start:2320 stop:4662 length:2343 start_codon:yes stop_codon:yes gene_type:complete
MYYSTKILFLIGFLTANSFKGQILDTFDKPINNASIQIIDNKNMSTLTDGDGYFSFDKTNDFFSIKISHIGYEDKIVKVNNSNKGIQKIKLLKASLDLNNILVTGLRKEMHVKDTPILTHVISSKDLKNTAYTNVKDILEITMPNVQNVVSSHAGTSNNRVKIQGLDNRYILFLIDGARVSGEFAGNLDFNMLNLSDVEKIEIVEGGMSSLYGSSAIGGVVNIITKKEKNPYWFNISLLNEDPMIYSRTLNFGFNYNKLYYNIDINNQGSDGYDLTPLESNNNGALIKTLEEYNTNSIKQNFKFNFNDIYSIELNSKNYSNKISQYENHLLQIIDQEDPNYPFYYYQTNRNNSPMFKDNRYGITFIRSKKSRNFKIAYNNEEYIKSNYFFNYGYEDCSSIDCNQSNNLIDAEFINAKNRNKSLLVQFDLKEKNQHLTFGFEANSDDYSSFNIYDYNLGDNNNDGLCGEGFPWDPDDCLVESIFNAQDDTKSFRKKAFFFGNQISLKNDNTLSISLRSVSSKNYENNSVYSFAYLSPNNENRNYNIRFNFSKGFRTPAIKELYYNFQGHSPPVVGNPDLRPTTNNFFSISFDKRDFDNNASLDFFYNNVKDLIGINSTTDELGENILLYSNFESVNFRGINFHYERILKNKTSMKLVYNHTSPKSNNKEALELISRNSLRFNIYAKTPLKKLDVSFSAKYSGDKIIYSGNEETTLDDYFMVDLLGIFQPSNLTTIKLGYKNLLDFKDDRRLLNDSYERDLLTSYDPGRRFIIELNYNFKGE